MTGLLAAGMLCRAGPAGWAAAAPGDPISSQWEGLLALEQGAWDAGKQAAGKTLWLRVEKADGQWRPEVWGYSRDFKSALQERLQASDRQTWMR
jgi:hypothetical protein